MEVEVVDVAGEAGRGCTVARGSFSASPPDWPGIAPQTVQLRLTGASDKVCGLNLLPHGVSSASSSHPELLD